MEGVVVHSYATSKHSKANRANAAFGCWSELHIHAVISSMDVNLVFIGVDPFVW